MNREYAELENSPIDMFLTDYLTRGGFSFILIK